MRSNRSWQAARAEQRIEEKAEIFDFALSDEDIAELDQLDETGGTARALERKW